MVLSLNVPSEIGGGPVDKRTAPSNLRSGLYGRVLGVEGLAHGGGPLSAVAVVCAGSIIVLVILTGCGRGGGEVAQGPPAPSAPEMYAEPGAPAEPARARPAQPAEEKPKVELPEDFAQWQEEHFKQARKEGGERLLKAVEWLGREAPDKDKAVEILVALLRKLPPEETPKPKPQPSPYPGAEGYPGASPEMYAEAYPGGPHYSGYPGAPGAPGRGAPAKVDLALIRAICDALGVLGTTRADETFREVLKAKMETDDDRFAQQAALDSLVRHLNPAREDLIFAVLTSPEEFRPIDPQAVRRPQPGYRGGPGGYPGEVSEYGPTYPGGYETYPGGYETPSAGYPGGPGAAASQKPMSAQELQEAAFAAIRPVASEEFRVRLARHVIDPKTPQEDFDLFLPYLLEDDARNLRAQVELLAHLAQDPNVRSVVERVALEVSSRAMAEVLGIPRDVVDEMSLMTRVRSDARRYGPRMPGESEYGPEYAMEPSMPVGPPAPTPPPGGGRPTRTGPARPSRFATPDQPVSSPVGVQPGPGRTEPAILRLSDLASFDSRVVLSLAGKIWSREVSALVEKELGAIRSFKDNPNAVLFASTFPVASVRRTLARVLRANWEEGPDVLEQSGILDSVVFGPGYLLAVKELPRKIPDPKAQLAGPGGMRPSLGRLGQARRPGGYGQPGRGIPGGRMPEGSVYPPGGVGPTGPEEMMPGGPGMSQPGSARPGRVIPGAESASPKDRAAMAWGLHLMDALKVMADRLYEASKTVGSGGFSLTATDEQAPEQQEKEGAFRLPPNAIVRGYYEVDIGKVLGEKVPGVPADNMRIKFWRLEDKTAPRTIVGFFRRTWGEGEEREFSGIHWIEMNLAGGEDGARRVVDILIDTGASAEPGGFTLGATSSREASTPSQIDIIVMELGARAAEGAE